MMLKKNDIVRLDITDITDKGDGLGKYEGFPLFVRHALPGDVLDAKVVKTKKTYGYAVISEMITPSPDRVKSACPVCRACGGCQLMEMSYEGQLRLKKEKVNSSLKRIGGFSDLEAEAIVPSPELLRYRNKAQFPVGYDRNGKLTSGFYARHSHDIISSDDCILMPEKFNHIKDCVLKWMEECGVSAYDEASHKGVVRHIFIREGRNTGQILVCLIINADDIPHKRELTERLLSFEGIVSVCVSPNKKPGNTIMGDTVKCIYGRPYIEETIGEKRFFVSPQSFFQVNPMQTEQLYGRVRELASLRAHDELWDIFCGIGTISIFCSDVSGNITGVEIVERAVKDAAENAELNNISNARYYAGPAEDILQGISFDINADRVVIIDPPRKGCDPAALDAIEALAPSDLIYVSCDPATLARDLKILVSKGYEIRNIRAYDMFPMTVHVETVVLMSRIKD